MEQEILRRVVRSEIKNINEKDYTIDVTMSDQTVDRYKEVILASAWKKRLGSYKAHPVLLSSHEYRGLRNQIGEAIKISVKDGKLATTLKYYVSEGNPESDWAWVLASKKIAAFSVGFIRHAGRYVDPDSDYKDDEEMAEFQKAGVRYVYDDVELLENSQVLVPANPSCLQDSFDQGMVVRSLEEQAYPQLAELEAALKSLPHKEEEKVVELTEEQKAEIEVEEKKWEETENEIRHRVRDPELFEKFRYITLKADKPRVRAILGKLKNEDNEWKIQSLRFSKADDWTMAKAKAWVKAHPDVTKDINEEEIIMGIDDLKEMVDELKAKFTADSEEQKKEFLALMETALKTICDEIARKTLETLDAELEKRKEKEVEEVIGVEKIDEIESEEKDADGILDVFKAVTDEMKQTFSQGSV